MCFQYSLLSQERLKQKVYKRCPERRTLPQSNPDSHGKTRPRSMNLINLLTLLAFCGLVLSLPDQELPSNVADLKESGSQPDGSIGDVEDDTLARTEQEVEDAMAKALVFEEDEMTR